MNNLESNLANIYAIQVKFQEKHSNVNDCIDQINYRIFYPKACTHISLLAIHQIRWYFDVNINKYKNCDDYL